jgi:hypothetical protein
LDAHEQHVTLAGGFLAKRLGEGFSHAGWAADRGCGACDVFTGGKLQDLLAVAGIELKSNPSMVLVVLRALRRRRILSCFKRCAPFRFHQARGTPYDHWPSIAWRLRIQGFHHTRHAQGAIGRKAGFRSMLPLHQRPTSSSVWRENGAPGELYRRLASGPSCGSDAFTVL